MSDGTKKLVVAIVRPSDDAAIVRALVTVGFRVTRVSSRGGFLRRGNITLLIGVGQDEVERVTDIIRRACRQTGSECGVTVFAVNAASIQQL